MSICMMKYDLLIIFIGDANILINFTVTAYRAIRVDGRADGQIILLSDLKDIFEKGSVYLSIESLRLIARAYKVNASQTENFFKVIDAVSIWLRLKYCCILYRNWREQTKSNKARATQNDWLDLFAQTRQQMTHQLMISTNVEWQ